MLYILLFGPFTFFTCFLKTQIKILVFLRIVKNELVNQ